MSLPGWKDLTTKAVAEFTGPVAELLIDDALIKTGINEPEMSPGLYIRFLQNLYAELPADLDRNTICQTVKLQVLTKYGF